MNYFFKKTGSRVIRWYNKGRALLRPRAGLAPGEYNAIPDQTLKDFNKSRPLGPQPILCYAPYKMMYFAFGGEVIACCHNRKHILGRYPEQSLTEIWEGQELKILRDHIEHNDLSYGCEVCKTLLLSKNFDGAKNALYDRYRVKPWPITMEFELDNRCNLACVICNEQFSSKITGKDQVPSPYDEKFVEQLKHFIPHLREAKFYGGEPFLIPLYYEIWETMLALNPEIHILIQTNGTVLNEKVERILQQGRFSINVSIDSLNKERFEYIRKNADFEKTIENTKWFAKYCRQQGTHFGIIPTPHRLNWMDLPEITVWAGEWDARVYFNTLITPLDLALWNLPSEELHKILLGLSEAQLPVNTAIAKANQVHFLDFLKQISAWEEANRQGVIASEKEIVTVGHLQKVKTVFLEKLATAVKDKHNSASLLLRFHHALAAVEGNQSLDLIFLVLEKTPMNEIIIALETLDEEHLRKIAGKKLFEAGGLYKIEESH
jgi:MoaA/NifB/PqqE/SkfB family radical SAM enzyme